ncbi:hypothetical protein Gbth_022_001 [Gluconobacter thailandicus F149-1 = NBRC 100600]|nr:hypothetical protein AD946_00750 [Gluconobacter thailandicus]GAN93231.1 hypothetical protein Gbth_022_001 [Gluconobacter thailandicus F149-1 = NBRC 100600]GBR59539.1 hypothetical protein AA100600_1369 [Gluconobacter thailandicus F149-1 = NBRC 100600]GEL88541.1 hypothetical protein GTH01_28990 [Gluconobacter thailandicus F149-1 = NBRC 100600]
MQTIRFGRIFPLKPVTDHIYDPAQDAPVIHTQHAVSQRKIRCNPFYLALRQQKHTTHRIIFHEKL